MLKADNLNKKIAGFSLTNISFNADKGDYFVLVGLSGAGKTMLLEIIAGLTNYDSGLITLNDKNISNLPIQERNIGLVYQNQTLFPHMSVYENIAYPLKCRKKNKAEIKDKVYQLASETEITHLLKRSPSTLSGGEAQRVAIARTLATDPDILLLDEPLSFLDVQLKRGISSLLRKINQKGQTIIHVTHDYEEAIALANKIAILENGTIVQTGNTHEVFHYPKSEFVANFIGIKNFYRGEVLSSDFNLKIFKTAGISIYFLSEDETASSGHIIIPAESIIISNIHITSSAVNNYEGIIKEIIPVKLGTEVIIDIGIEISALVTNLSIDKFHFDLNKKVWINFKASSVKFIKE